MRILYLECNAGASGDMMLGALSELLEEGEAERILSSIGVPDTAYSFGKGERGHLRGTKATVLVRGREEHEPHHHQHHHRSLPEVLEIIRSLNISDRVKEHAVAIYTIIASAEAEAHGVPVGEVHFHEVGMLDAIADVVGACALIERLSPDRIEASPLRTGHGYVQCAHGSLPIPAPATAIILKGIPTYAGDIEGEFTTPTGAAIVKHFAEEYGPRPRMSVDGIGCGLGGRETEIPNALRAFIGDSGKTMPAVKVLSCNIDDMTAEDLGAAIPALMADGALDAFVIPSMMKKGRPGHVLACICRAKDADAVAASMLRNTSTIGIRVTDADRYEMTSHFEI